LELDTMEGSASIPAGAGGQQQPGTSATRQCVSCGRTIDWHSNVCPYCGHDYRMAQTAPAAPEKGDSILPVIGGVLILIAGLAAIGMGGMFMALDVQEIQDAFVDLEGYDLTPSELDDILTACGAMALIFGVIATIGGVFAIMKKHFGLAVVGGIFAILGVGLFVGSVLGLIGLILVAVGRSSFSK
jgi:hypothetical protein